MFYISETVSRLWITPAVRLALLILSHLNAGFNIFKCVLVDDVFVLLPGAVLFSLAGAPSLTESEQRHPRGVKK